MRPPLATGVEQSVPIDDPVTGIRQKREIRLHAIRGDLVGHRLQQFTIVDRQREEFDVGLRVRIEQRFQLHELICAIGSPMPPVEHEDDSLLAAEL